MEVWLYVCIYVCVCMFVCLCVYLYVCLYVCIFRERLQIVFIVDDFLIYLILITRELEDMELNLVRPLQQMVGGRVPEQHKMIGIGVV